MIEINFATGRTNRDDDRALVVKASIRFQDLVRFSKLCLNVSFDVVRWVLFLKTVSKKKQSNL